MKETPWPGSGDTRLAWSPWSPRGRAAWGTHAWGLCHFVLPISGPWEEREEGTLRRCRSDPVPVSPSFERLLLHALCQYMDLVSASKSLVFVWFRFCCCFSLLFITISPLQLNLFLPSSPQPHLVLQLTDNSAPGSPGCGHAGAGTGGDIGWASAAPGCRVLGVSKPAHAPGVSVPPYPWLSLGGLKM